MVDFLRSYPRHHRFHRFHHCRKAETNRAPFRPGRSRIGTHRGFHAGYSGMKLPCSSWLNVFIVCAIGATLFLGGWMPFHIGHWAAFNHVMDFIPWYLVPGQNIFTDFPDHVVPLEFPRLRIDQLLNLEWKYLLPISMINILLVAAAFAILGMAF